jgi:hypothetical protein
MVYFANSQTLLYVRLTFLHNQTNWSHVFHMCVVPHHEYARVDGVIYSMDPIFSVGCPRVLYVCFPYASHTKDDCSIQDEHDMSCDVTMFCHTCAYRITNMWGKDTLHSKGGCLRLDAVHAAAWCMDAISIVNDNVCGRFRDVLARKVFSVGTLKTFR